MIGCIGNTQLIPLLAMLLAVFATGQIFVYTAWYGYLVWIVALHVCCFATHDWKASSRTED